MVDREARNRMIEALESYMDEHIRALEFDDALVAIEASTSDETVKLLRWDLWSVYDDLEDHKVIASKEEWDALNRVRLFLESDAEIEMERRWTWRQAAAITGLLCY